MPDYGFGARVLGGPAAVTARVLRPGDGRGLGRRAARFRRALRGAAAAVQGNGGGGNKLICTGLNFMCWLFKFG